MSRPVTAEGLSPAVVALAAAVGPSAAREALTEELVWAVGNRRAAEQQPEETLAGVLGVLERIVYVAAEDHPAREVCEACGSLALADYPCDVCAAYRRAAEPVESIHPTLGAAS